nr:glycosyltransferase family 4 protein [Chloroflexota bacterium]
MTIYVLDARTATNHFPGIGRYVINLTREMVSLLRARERLFLLRDPTSTYWSSLEEITQGAAQLLDVPFSCFSIQQQWVIPRVLRQVGANLYHSTYYLMPYRPGAPTLLTVYDLIPLLFPEYVSFQARLLFRYATALALRAATHVLTISETTRRDLLSLFHTPAHKTTSVPLAADPRFYPRLPSEIQAVREQYALPEHYALYVGINKPHKNLVRLVEAWAQLQPQPLPLVIAGVWDIHYPEPRQRAQSLGLHQSIIWLGPVPEAVLPALYSGATVFVFPSLYEGFGLPVLEAMACGTPVVCSNTPSLLEIGDTAVRFFDPTSVDGIRAALHQVLVDTQLQRDLRERGLARAAQFSWQKTAQRTLELYSRLV